MQVFGEHEENTLEQLRNVAKNAEHVALMADGHLGFVMPIGGVAAYDNKVSVVGVGFDIACGNCCIKTNMDAHQDYLNDEAADIANDIASTFSFGIGRTNANRDAPTGHGMFDHPDWDAIPAHVRDILRHKAIGQLGTIGGGNHYIDVFVEQDEYDHEHVWVGVHFGSRGFGHGIASGFMALAQGEEWGKRVPEVETLLDLDSELGQSYWAAMELAGQYAYIGREYVARKVVTDLLGAKPLEIVHNHHNYAWREWHFGRDLIVVRKGATPAFPGQRGFIGGSMGDDAYIVEGASLFNTDSDPQTLSMYSTVHGAGRVMSRSMAAGSRPKKNKATGEVRQRKKGVVTRQMMSEWTKSRGIIVRGGDVDESPHVYRRLKDVIAAQGETINVRHVLSPKIVVMAGADTSRDD